MQGNTNAVIGKGGGGGATVTAINKTGSTITTGQKVWLNENVQVAGSSYNFAGSNEKSYLSRSGNFAYANGETYSITNESATNAGSISAGSGKIRYMADNSIFANYGRIDEVAQYRLPTTNYCFGDDYFGFDDAFNKINMTDGSVIQSWTLGSGATYTVQSETCKVGNYFYRLSHNSTYSIKVTLNDDGTATGVRYNFSNVDTNTRYPIGVTADNKYIICDLSLNNLDGSHYLRMIEVIDEDNFKELQQSEMPAELQKYFSTAKGYFVFNPYTGILTAVDSTSIDYVVMKYENGEWITVPVTLDLPEDITSFTSGLVVSDDLSRASISYKATQYGSYAYSHIHNLTTTQGYAAVPYKFYNINENTITGYAGNDTEADGEVEVSVAGQPSVNPSPILRSPTALLNELLMGNISNITAFSADLEATNVYAVEGDENEFYHRVVSTSEDYSDEGPWLGYSILNQGTTIAVTPAYRNSEGHLYKHEQGLVISQGDVVTIFLTVSEGGYPTLNITNGSETVSMYIREGVIAFDENLDLVIDREISALSVETIFEMRVNNPALYDPLGNVIVVL